MFIFVEGPDGAGKTTFIEQLKHKIGSDAFGIPNYEVKHFGIPEDPTTQVGMYLNAINCSYKLVTIFDRCWYSDMVYAPIMRNQESMPIEDSRLLEEFVRNNGGGMVYYLTSKPSTLWERCQKRGEDYIKDIEQLIRIKNLYETVMDKVDLPIKRIVT